MLPARRAQGPALARRLNEVAVGRHERHSVRESRDGSKVSLVVGQTGKDHAAAGS